MTKEQLDVAMAMLDAHAEERRRQHAEINTNLNKAIKRHKLELCVWECIIVISIFMIVETVLSLVY